MFSFHLNFPPPYPSLQPPSLSPLHPPPPTAKASPEGLSFKSEQLCVSPRAWAGFERAGGLAAVGGGQDSPREPEVTMRVMAKGMGAGIPAEALVPLMVGGG